MPMEFIGVDDPSITILGRNIGRAQTSIKRQS